VILLAECGNRSVPQRVGAAIVILGILAVWAAVVWFAVWYRASGEERGWLVLVFAASVVLGGVIFLVPGGVTGDGDYLTRFLVSLVLTAAGGSVVARLSLRFSPGRGLWAAVAGDIVVPGALILFLFWGFLVEGWCLD
jgi:hypothetical protein